MRFHTACFGLLCLTAGLLGGCGILKKPDMSRTASIAKLRKPRHPLILIPGFLGTKLKDPETGRVVWGKMSNVLLGGDDDILALAPGADDTDVQGERVEPFAIYDSLWGVEYYRKIISTLRSAGGYQIGDIDDPRPGDNAFVFIYDWRRDNAGSAQRLAKAIEHIKAALGDETLTFDLLAHSQGGLIARYYVKYGGAPLADSGPPPRPTMVGAGNIHKVIMLGTPNQGCLQALKILHVGVRKVFRPIRPEVVFTMPSVYQMLPPPGATIFADMEGQPVPLDLYDPDTWVKEGLSAFSRDAQQRLRRKVRKGALPDQSMDELNRRFRRLLEWSLNRAKRFRAALEAPAEVGSDVAYYAFGSDCMQTPRAALLVHRKGRKEVVFDHDRIPGNRITPKLSKALYGAGDGTVLMESLLELPDKGQGPRSDEEESVRFQSAFFVCESHGVLANNPIFQNNLFYVLLLEDEAGSPPDPVLPGLAARQ
ncbi:MAG: hypothetical protein ACE5HU_00445 [Acidobacteriota bacterium]